MCVYYSLQLIVLGMWNISIFSTVSKLKNHTKSYLNFIFEPIVKLSIFITQPKCTILIFQNYYAMTNNSIRLICLKKLEKKTTK